MYHGSTSTMELLFTLIKVRDRTPTTVSVDFSSAQRIEANKKSRIKERIKAPWDRFKKFLPQVYVAES